ncbi:peroxisome biogenesis protein 6-like [Diospyros lotus]|uniref:peroxisome biogenesis protein 6-like n=1 Tax=Diospyros lotus TaxID=55363 RepID=UPI00224CFF21|nr:peroxisome biogenesis protein 6-like [Diospyros lotus]
MGSPLDQVGVSSEVASVIKEYTEPVSEEEIIYCEKNSDGDSQMKAAESISRHPLLLVAASDSSEGLPPTIRRCFTHEISMGPLTEEQRAEMLSQTLHHVSGLLPNSSMSKSALMGNSAWRELVIKITPESKNMTCLKC